MKRSVSPRNADLPVFFSKKNIFSRDPDNLVILSQNGNLVNLIKIKNIF